MHAVDPSGGDLDLAATGGGHVVDSVFERSVADHVVHDPAGGDDHPVAGLLDALLEAEERRRWVGRTVLLDGDHPPGAA